MGTYDLENLLVPVLGRLVVNNVMCTQLARGFEFVVG
jgi:hypothetical protein